MTMIDVDKLLKKAYKRLGKFDYDELLLIIDEIKEGNKFGVYMVLCGSVGFGVVF